MPSQPMPNTNDIEKSANSEVGTNIKDGLADNARQAGAALTETAQRVGDQAKETASSLASDAQHRFHGYMDQQVAAGADLAGRVASVIKTAMRQGKDVVEWLSGLFRGIAPQSRPT